MPKTIALGIFCSLVLIYSTILFGIEKNSPQDFWRDCKNRQMLDDFSADFRQERRVSFLKKPLKSDGRILFLSSGALRWETQSPIQSLLIYNKSRFVKFERKGNGWAPLSVRVGSAIMSQLMAQIHSLLSGHWLTEKNAEPLFVIEDKYSEKPSSENKMFSLVPSRPDKSPISRILMEVSSKTCRAHVVTVSEVSGDEIKISFRNFQKLSKTDSDKLFDLDQPI